MGFLRDIRSTFRLGRPEDMPCRDVVEIVTSYLEGDLDPALRARLEAHLATCPECVLYVDQMRQTIELAGATAEPEDLPPELREHLQRVFDDWIERESAV